MVLAQVGAQSHALLYVESRNRHLRGRRALCSHSGGAICWLGVNLDAYPRWVCVEVNVGSVRCLVEWMESILVGGVFAMNRPATPNSYLPKVGCRASVSLIYSISISSRILSPFCFADHAPYQVPLFRCSYISVCAFNPRRRIECSPVLSASSPPFSPPFYPCTTRVVAAEMRGTQRWLCFRHHTFFFTMSHHPQLLPTMLSAS
jgi:hypothetical protein